MRDIALKYYRIAASLLKVGVFLIIFQFIFSSYLYSQNKPATEYQVKSAFIFNFTRFVEWPASAFKSDDAPFVIGIIGPDPFGPYIDELVNGEKKGNHPIVIKRVADIKEELDCHILFVNIQNPEKLKAYLAAVNQNSVLTISDAPGFVKWGGIISFYKEDSKIRLQINAGSAKAAKLDLSSKLLSLAKIYNYGG
ncbi:YfiR family protein [Rubrolithibacter danxiaensis]|uniref:YfiR family protein n=1 Tax=Rubrolithibacter danxiaensis TaxID=3390805 RepID=UPI003BF77540